VLYYLYMQNKEEYKTLESLKVGKLKRKKIRVARENLLDNAIVIFDAFGNSKSLLEFEYINEEGTGLGPTLEYYTLVTQEILDKGALLWRTTDDNSLFPAAVQPTKLFTTP